MKTVWMLAMAAWMVAALVMAHRLMTVGWGSQPCPPERRRRLTKATWILAFIGAVLGNAALWFG